MTATAAATSTYLGQFLRVLRTSASLAVPPHAAVLFLADQCLRVLLVRVTSQFLRIVLFLPELLGIMIALRSCETS